MDEVVVEQRASGDRDCAGIDGNLVRDALALLPDRHCAMIYRSYYLGRTTTQLAAELGANDDSVKAELHRALHALRRNLTSTGDRHPR